MAQIARGDTGAAARAAGSTNADAALNGGNGIVEAGIEAIALTGTADRKVRIHHGTALQPIRIIRAAPRSKDTAIPSLHFGKSLQSRNFTGISPRKNSIKRSHFVKCLTQTRYSVNRD
jgi:hypothetical protein